MIHHRKESKEVLYCDHDIIVLEKMDLDELKQLAMLNPRKRIRICSHQSPEDLVQEMIIVHTNGTYVRPHKHLGKAESFSILEGETDIILFEEDGAIRQVIRMGTPDSGLPFYYRISSAIFHTLLIRTEFLVFHEVTQGPFDRQHTIFAEWARHDFEAEKYLHADLTFTVAQMKRPLTEPC